MEEQKEPTPNIPNFGAIQVFKAFLAGINEAGIATVLLIVFLLMYMGVLPSGVSQAFDTITKEHTVSATKHAEDAALVLRSLNDFQNTQLRLIRQICRNTAKNDTQAIECDR